MLVPLPFSVVGVSAVAYCFPAYFTPLLPYTGLMLALIMFGMGVMLTPADFLRVFSRPAPVLLGLGLHYLVMPLAAWGIARAFQLPPALTVGMVLVGSVSGGTASNVITYLAGGYVALSVTVTALSTLAGVFVTPLLTRLYLDASIEVNTYGMLLSILQVVVLPISLGMLAQRFAAPLIRRVDGSLPLISMAAIVLLIAVIFAGSQKQIATIGADILLAVVLHNAIGLFCGYWGARAFGFDERVCRTLSIEVGMQNSGLAAQLGKAYFSLSAALPGALFSIWHNLSGSLLASYWRKRA